MISGSSLRVGAFMSRGGKEGGGEIEQEEAAHLEEVECDIGCSRSEDKS